jgi:hypothetical protein
MEKIFQQIVTTVVHAKRHRLMAVFHRLFSCQVCLSEVQDGYTQSQGGENRSVLLLIVNVDFTRLGEENACRSATDVPDTVRVACK